MKSSISYSLESRLELLCNSIFSNNFVNPHGVGMGGKVGVSGGEDIWIEAFERRRGEDDGEEGGKKRT